VKTGKRGRRGKRPKSNAALHSSNTEDYGTGRDILDIGRAVLGWFTVDPFSSEKWNTVIEARRIITAAEDGFITPWFRGAPAPLQVLSRPDRVGDNTHTAIVNAPGGLGGKNVKNAWWALSTYWDEGWIAGGAMWVGFTLNHMQTCQGPAVGERRCPSPFDPRFAGFRCVPEKRLPYQVAPGVPAEEPTHPSWFMLLPSTSQEIANRQLRAFAALAERLGGVF
jgi:hypothetical protein